MSERVGSNPMGTGQNCTTCVCAHMRAGDVPAERVCFNLVFSGAVTRASRRAGEVLWDNVAVRGWERTLRSVAAWGAFTLMMLFFLPVVAAVQSVLNLDQYEDRAAIAAVLDLPVVAGARPPARRFACRASTPASLTLLATGVECSRMFDALCSRSLHAPQAGQAAHGRPAHCHGRALRSCVRAAWKPRHVRHPLLSCCAT